MATYFGKNGRRYELGTKKGEGGEGIVYLINGMPDSVAKIYKPDRMQMKGERDSMHEKLEAMLAAPLSPYVNGVLTIAWPTDILLDGNGEFQGFVMPLLENKKSLIWACRESDRNTLFHNRYSWKCSLGVAYNLAIAVENVHNAGVVVGDMNPNNILVDEKGYVTLIDADSFTITASSGKVFRCCVGMEEVLPAELQGKDLSKPGNDYNVFTDRFALAIHIFNLLCNNCHPFGCLDLNSPNSSASKNPRVHNITKGYCPYVTGGRGKVPDTAPDMAMLPLEIRELFDRVFKYDARSAIKQDTKNARPSAKEWREALYRMLNQKMNSCPVNSQHVYPRHYTAQCPWCAISNKTSNKPVPAPKPKPAPQQNQNTGSNFGNAVATHTRYNRRKPTALYTMCMSVGAIGSALAARIIQNGISSNLDFDMNVMVIAILVGLIGLVCGWFIAVMAEDRYIKASNGWPWLMISLLAPVAAWIVAFLLIIALYIVIGILGTVIVLAVIASACCGEC